MATEREKMTAGEPYDELDGELTARRDYMRQQLEEINHITDNQNRNDRFKALIADTGDNFFVETSFKFDYGFNIHLGEHFYANYDVTMLDTCPITIGPYAWIGPNCGFYTPIHPLDPVLRRDADVELGAPITIGHSVWMGGGVIILPGVTLGDNVVVGAGSVVTKSFGDNVVIAGNPARVNKPVPKHSDK